jgi:catechol 2,3-dioxygenase-like lactoylglutathione lyase family enzyme
VETIGKTPILEFKDMRGKIGVLLLTVRDFSRVLMFYRHTGLTGGQYSSWKGFELLVDWVRFELERGTALELSSETRIGQHNVSPFPRTNAMVIAFIVEDIDATYAELKAKGVEFLNGIGEEERGQYAPFRDPDGNRLQRYQPHLGS